MIIRNCLGLLEELSQIELEIKVYEQNLRRLDPDCDSDYLLKQILEKYIYLR